MELWNDGAKSRVMSRAYDFVLLMFAPWFLLAAVPWVPWTVFLLANLSGLFLFNNRFVRRDASLTRRWDVVFALCGIGLLTLWPLVLTLDGERRIMGIFGVAFLVAVRLCFQPAEAPVRGRRQGQRPDPG
jgi:hypothetical protein